MNVVSQSFQQSLTEGTGGKLIFMELKFLFQLSSSWQQLQVWELGDEICLTSTYTWTQTHTIIWNQACWNVLMVTVIMDVMPCYLLSWMCVLYGITAGSVQPSIHGLKKVQIVISVTWKMAVMKKWKHFTIINNHYKQLFKINTH
jgi:hypothetical protein